jgi:hypothetical protein
MCIRDSGILLTDINTKDSTCAVDGAVPILTTTRNADLRELYQKEIVQANYLATTEVQLNEMEGLWIAAQWSGGAFLRYDTERDIFGTEVITENPELSKFLSTLVNFFDFNVRSAWVVSGWEGQLATVAEQLDVDYGFASAGCFVAPDIGEVDLSVQGAYRLRVDSTTTLKLNGMSLDVLGAGMLFAGEIPIPGTVVIGVGDMKVYGQSINLQAGLEAKVNLAIVDQHVYFGPFSSAFEASVYHSGKLAEGDFVGYPVVLLGLGWGEAVSYTHLTLPTTPYV